MTGGGSQTCLVVAAVPAPTAIVCNSRAATYACFKRRRNISRNRPVLTCSMDPHVGAPTEDRQRWRSLVGDSPIGRATGVRIGKEPSRRLCVHCNGRERAHSDSWLFVLKVFVLKLDTSHTYVARCQRHPRRRPTVSGRHPTTVRRVQRRRAARSIGACPASAEDPLKVRVRGFPTLLPLSSSPGIRGPGWPREPGNQEPVW